MDLGLSGLNPKNFVRMGEGESPGPSSKKLTLDALNVDSSVADVAWSALG